MKTKKYTIVSSDGSVHQTDDPKVVEYAARFEKLPEEQKKLVMEKLRELKRLDQASKKTKPK
jgi:DNA-directed RNA polymerase subunit F